MAPWIYIALAAQALNAVAFLVDKYLVGPRADVRPVIYAFYVGILSGPVVWLLPFGVVSWPDNQLIRLSLVTAVAYLSSLVFLYKSLRVADASDVAPIMGAVSALATLFFRWWILKDGLSDNFMLAFFLLVLGTILMSYFRFDKRSFFNVLLAGTLFGLATVWAKEIFTQTTFWNGFFWSRMGNVVVAIALLAQPSNCKAIFKHLHHATGQTKVLVVGNKILASLAFLLILWAIQLGDVSMVSAIGGMQFIFLIILALIFAKKFPDYFVETIRIRSALIQKIVAIALIVCGYFLLFS